MRRWMSGAVAAALPALLTGLSGCGTPAAPQPPSLNLPDRVADLSAVRTGNNVLLTWTMPKRNTDKLALTGDVAVHVCREEAAGPCEAAGPDQMLAPGATHTFSDTLPPRLAAGSPRVLRYFVELKNQKGRSAGLSNAATVLAGQAPAPVAGLTAEVRKDGVVLRWTPDGETVPVRLQRTLLTPPPATAKQGPLAAPPEPLEQNLLVDTETQTGRAIDKSILFGETYSYRAQRVARVEQNGQTVELAGDFSPPVRVEALDVFPPAVPTGLAAVATLGEAGAPPAIDLSWQPDSDADLAGYIVYRREGDAAWLRLSSAQPVVGPAFHDAQVQAGHTYHYAVSAIDRGGHESTRSAEAEETVPSQ